MESSTASLMIWLGGMVGGLLISAIYLSVEMWWSERHKPVMPPTRDLAWIDPSDLMRSLQSAVASCESDKPTELRSYAVWRGGPLDCSPYIGPVGPSEVDDVKAALVYDPAIRKLNNKMR